MSTGNHHTSERGSLGHDDVVVLEARRNKQVYKQCDKSSSKEEDNCFEDQDIDIMKGLESTSKKYDESSSDSDNIEYDFQDNQKQRKVKQMEEDFTINKWRSLKSLKPQGMHLNDWLSIHLKKDLMLQRTSRRMIPGLWKAKKVLIEGSGNGEMTMVSCILMKLKRYSGWTQRNHQYLKTGIMSRGQTARSREKDHFRMETEQRQEALASLGESAQ